MDKAEIIELLENGGLISDLKSTQLRQYTIPRNGRSSFVTDGALNRSNTTWGRGEYIIVEYDPQDNTEIEKVLERWKQLAGPYKNQFLILGISNDDWNIYDFNGNLLGGNDVIKQRFDRNTNNVLLREKRMATFFAKAMKITLQHDPAFEKMQKEFQIAANNPFLKFGNSFNLGRDQEQEVRPNDVDKTVSWNYNGKKYWLYLEHTINKFNTEFVPKYNDCYNSLFRIRFSKSLGYSLISLSQIKTDSQKAFLPAIRTKPFILLAGISGTGKSRIVRKLAQASVTEDLQRKYDPKSIGDKFDCWKLHKPANFELIQVKPNWHNSMEVVGYKSNIGGTHYEFTPFIEFVARAWQHQDLPFFLCLDEMNLAPVEQYFAEFLSAIESRTFEGDEYMTDPIIKPFDSFGQEVCNKMLDALLPKIPASEIGTPSAEDIKKLKTHFKTKGLTLPKNLIVMGTVNMDETTFSFSRKVLDRAMSVVMNEVDFEAFLTGDSENDVPIMNEDDKYKLINRPLKGIDIANEDDKAAVKTYLARLNENDLLGNTPFKLGYRAINEALLYVCASREFGVNDINTALDQFTMMKILSRIEGDKRSIGSLLEDLKVVITDVYKDSSTKLYQMAETLKNSQFVSYWT